jgi:signal transduction histidine kinase
LGFKKERTRTLLEKQSTEALFDLTIAAENLELQTPKFIVFLKSIKLVEMTLKYLARLALILLISILSCTKSQKGSQTGTEKDSISYYINKASEIRIPYKERLAYNQKALELLLVKENDSMSSDLLIKVARNFSRLHCWSSLKQTSQSVLERSLKKKDYYFIAQSYRWLGIYYENISVNDKAFYYYLQAEKIFKKLRDNKMLCLVYRDEAIVRYFSNDFLGSDESLIKALKIANEIQNIALRLLKTFNSNSYQYIVCNNHIGANYFDKGEFTLSVKFYKDALDHIKFIYAEPDYYTKTLDNLMRSKVKLKEYKGVEDAYLRASRIRDSLKIDFGRNHNKLFLSEYYQATNQTIKAQQFAHEAYSLSKSYRNAGDMLQCLKQLATVEPQNALKYSQDYIRISDSMQQLERQTRNKFAAIAYETEEITTEKEQAIQQKWIFFGIAVLVFIIGGLVILLLIQRAKQKELRFLQEQQKTNEEIYQLIQNQQTKIDEARQIEKKRIAQDLHDGIMNRLSSTRLNLHILNENATPEIIKKCLPFIAGIQDIEKEIRNISHDLNKDAIFNKVSFVAVLETFIEEQKPFFAGKCHLEIERNINWEWLSTFQKIHIFRMLQEAFQNIVKHAQAKNIIISILKNENQLLLEIFDDGVGFSLKQKKKGIGLQNIFSRAKQCRGNAEINSEVGTGTTIRITIPLSPKL